jgi:hypothetical protein
MSNKQLILAFFPDEPAADGAAAIHATLTELGGSASAVEVVDPAPPTEG